MPHNPDILADSLCSRSYDKNTTLCSHVRGESLQVILYQKVPAEAALQAEIASLREVDQAAVGSSRGERLILWEAERPCVVIPRTGTLETHLLRPAQPCVPVYRRESGGAAVLLGPGCLNYAVVVSLRQRPDFADVEYSYGAILEILVRSLRVGSARVIGSDLALGDRKFGGHAQRRTRYALLHHGTILYDFDLGLMDRILEMPARRPAYRGERRHGEFLTNLTITLNDILGRFEDFARRMTSGKSTKTTSCDQAR